MATSTRQRLTLRTASAPTPDVGTLLRESGVAQADAERITEELQVQGRAEYVGDALPSSVLADAGVVVERLDEDAIEVDGQARAVVQGAWSRIEAVLVQRAPEALLALRGPASSDIVRSCQEQCGLTLPQEFVAWLCLHDGEAETDEHGPFGWRLTPLEESLGAWRMLTDVLDDGAAGGTEADDGVRAVWWSRGWWPFAENGAGDRLCLDLDPAGGGRTGQIVAFHQDDDHRELIAAGFAQWMLGRAENLEGGRLVLIESANGRFTGVVPPEDLERLPLCTERIRGEAPQAYRARLARVLLGRAPVLAQYLTQELRARRLLVEDVPHGSVTVSLVTEAVEPHLGQPPRMAEALAKALPGVPGVSLPVPVTADFLESLIRNVEAGYP